MFSWAGTMSAVGNTIGFSAPRKVVFTDWRIAMFHMSLLAITLYYCYVTAVSAQGYLYKEIPTGDIAIYASSAGGAYSHSHSHAPTFNQRMRKCVRVTPSSSRVQLTNSLTVRVVARVPSNDVHVARETGRGGRWSN